MSITITSAHIRDLRSIGWVSVPLGLDESELHEALRGVSLLKNRSEAIDYKFRRTYFPSLLVKNTAAVEAPFNASVNNRLVRSFFEKIKLGSAVKALLGWDETFLVLARLFTMSSRNYLGNWHRDFESGIWDGNLDSLSSIQIAIYLQDQPGFRIIKRNNDFNGIDPKVSYNLPRCPLPLLLNPNVYDEVPGKAGTAVFFAPGLAHQGHSITSRLDFHMRFSRREDDVVARMSYKREDFVLDKSYDFYLHKDLSESANPNEIITIPRHHKPQVLKKVIYDLNYFFPVYNLYKKLMMRGFAQDQSGDKVIRVSTLGNTLYQERETY